MKNNFFINQNISNNIIVKKPNNNYKKKNQLNNDTDINNNSSSDEDKNVTIDNINNDSIFSLGIEEVPLPEDNYEHHQKYNQQKSNTSFYNSQNNNSVNRNNTKTNFLTRIINFLTEDKQLNDKKLPLTTNNSFNAKSSVKGEKIASQLTESKFNSSSEKKNNFIIRNNASAEQLKIIGRSKGIPLNNRKNNQFQTTKIIKLNEIKDEEKPINKILTKKNDKYKTNSHYATNIFNKNTNINIILSPQRHLKMSGVKKANNLNLEINENIIINNKNNSNNNIENGKKTENFKLIKNINKKLNNTRYNSSEVFNNINKTVKNKLISNLNLNDVNNTMGSFIKKKIIISNDEMNTSNNYNNTPNSITEIGSINNNMENERYTCSSFNFPLDNHKKKNEMRKKNLYLNNPPENQIFMDKQINKQQNINQTHSESNSQKGITIKKFSPDKQSIPQINEFFLNQIDRQAVSPKPTGIKKQINLMSDINESKINKVKKSISHINSLNNLNNIHMKNNTNFINNINNSNSMKNINSIYNNKTRNNKNNNNEYDKKYSNSTNNEEIINQNKHLMMTNVNTPKNNAITQNFNLSNKNPLLNSQPLNNQFNRNNLSNNYLSQEMINQQNNNFINNDQALANIAFQKEKQRTTQIPNNFNLQHLENQIPFQNHLFNQTQIKNIDLNKINNIGSNDRKSKNEVNLKNKKFEKSGWMKKYAMFTQPGKDESGNKKTNQDSFVFKTNINNIRDFNIFGVLDGHGPDGHYISQFASEFIPSHIINNPEIKTLTDPEKIYNKLKENKCRIITESFIEADNKLKNVNFNAMESGSTCTLVIHIGSHIICANVGDSRAIVVFDEKGHNNVDNYKERPLSIDYKPELPEETNRILRSGGVVAKINNELGIGVGPYRVWAKGKDYPGLAMSRSIGDLKGKNFGIIPNPGIFEYNLNKNTKYIVVCSDGVWEFLDNKAVKDLGKNYYVNNYPKAFCHELVNQALFLWVLNDIVVDDITAVVAFF